MRLPFELDFDGTIFIPCSHIIFFFEWFALFIQCGFLLSCGFNNNLQSLIWPLWCCPFSQTDYRRHQYVDSYRYLILDIERKIILWFSSYTSFRGCWFLKNLLVWAFFFFLEVLSRSIDDVLIDFYQAIFSRLAAFFFPFREL